MNEDATPKTQEEIEELLKQSLKHIEHSHMDELFEIERGLAGTSAKDDDTTTKIQLLKEQLS